MNIKFYLSFILIVLGVNLQSQGQASYNKRAGGPVGEGPKIGTISRSYSIDNVDRSTGTVNINIPLYEIKAHDISIPISISYSTLGLKVGQEAGAPGMGWELNTGGKMNKQVNGLEDNTSTPSLNSTNLMTLDPDNNGTHRSLMASAMDGQADYAYDVFSYSVPSGSGKFTEQGQTFPYDPTFKYENNFGTKITTGNGLVHHFTSADKLIVSKRKFYKLKNSSTGDLTEIPGGTWDLEKKSYFADYNLDMITSPRTKDTVKYVYDIFTASYYNIGIPGKTRITTTETLPCNRDLMYNSFGQWVDVNGQNYFIGEPTISQTKVEVNTHARIKEIIYATGKVEFKYNSTTILSRDVLTEVNIYRKVDGVYTRFKYYQFNYDADMQYGHYLDHIDVFNAGGLNAGKYKFKYFGENEAPGALGKLPVVPTSDSKAKDRWGFYNGHTENKTLIEHPDSLINLRDIPHLMISRKPYGGSTPLSFEANRMETKQFYDSLANPMMSVNVSWANRSTDSVKMMLGTLSRISTPSGETAEFEYELHRYRIMGTRASDHVNYFKTYRGGGIRIKSILRRDGEAFQGQMFSKKVFTYGSATVSNPHTNTESGWGIVNIPGVILSSNTRYIMDNHPETYKEDLQMLSHPLNDLVIHNGSYAYYPSVSESTYDGPFLKNQTVYYFMFGTAAGPWNYPTPSSLETLGFPEHYINMGVKKDEGLGKAAMVVEYNNSRINGARARSTIYHYSNFNAPPTVPKAYSRFTGLTGTRVGNYTSSFGACNIVEDPDYPGQFKFACLQMGTIQNMDPIGYKEMSPESPYNYYPGKYYLEVVDLTTLSDVYKLTRTTTSTWNTIYVDSITNLTQTAYENINHMQPTLITNYSSQGDTTATRIKYAYDYLNSSVTGATLLRGANIQTEPLEQLSMVKKNGVFQILGGVMNTFKSENNLIVNNSIYGFNTGGKLVPVNDNTEVDPRYKLESTYDVYDTMGNPILYSNLSGPKTALVWGYGRQYPIAEIVNVANTNDFAFTNFEENDKSYWVYSGSPVADGTSPSGDHVYQLANGSISKQNYVVGKKYVLAYWYKRGAVINITGGTVGPEIIKNTKADWVFAERTITVSSSPTISGTGTIDELRFYPADAMMRNFNYVPGLGITSMLDAKGQSASYEYDNEQRVKAIKDQNGNIVKAYDYNIGIRYRQ
ncbi:hypothetical protein [Pedobacter ginsengisoli]|uniref:hypothetical protein n=1 Tax=Pedobacter ginsengisoli TaxID=363852 RepID=UPI00254B0AFD|nr:hypothetical protein [Pedobacter ginsengisoli]